MRRELTPRLRTFKIRRGRRKNLERVESGTTNVLLKDQDGALDPSNVSSPYYPYVRVLEPVYLARRQGGVIYDRFTGRLERIIPKWQPPNYQEQEMVASDAFQALSALELESGQASLQTLLIGADNDLVFTAREPGGRGDEITIAYVVAGTNTPLDGATNEPLQGGALFDEFYGTLEWSNRWRMEAPAPPPPLKFEVRGSDISITVSTNASGSCNGCAARTPR